MINRTPENKFKSITLGKNIKAIRHSMKCTQEQFAEKLDISSQFLSQVERGIAGISLDTAIRICHISHCSPTVLLKDLVELSDTLDKYSLLSDTNKNVVNQLIEVLLNNQD